MSDKSFFRLTDIFAVIAFFMPVVASYAGLIIHGNLNGADAGVAPILMGVYNLPFIAAVGIALLVRNLYIKRESYIGAKVATNIALIVSLISLAFIIPWGLKG